MGSVVRVSSLRSPALITSPPLLAPNLPARVPYLGEENGQCGRGGEGGLKHLWARESADAGGRRETWGQISSDLARDASLFWGFALLCRHISVRLMADVEPTLNAAPEQQEILKEQKRTKSCPFGAWLLLLLSSFLFVVGYCVGVGAVGPVISVGGSDS